MRLQDYLETKRIAFPRFYFVAPADLLDILAKGSNPQHIIRLAASAACCQPLVIFQGMQPTCQSTWQTRAACISNA